MAKEIRIDNRIIGDKHPVYIVAEIGVNHNGQLDLALQLIDLACEASVDAVKFQTFNTSNLIIGTVAKAPYQMVTTPAAETQHDMLKKLEIDEAFHRKIIDHCNLRRITFLSTPYDEKSLDLLLELNVPAIKVASTDNTNLLFLERIASTGIPVIMATGMCSLDEIELSYKTLRDNGCKDLVLLKCTSDYPAKIEEVNLWGISTLSEKFNTIVGFSDHTAGIGASPYAVACGAKIIEKHFTIDKNMKGPDHAASLSPDELGDLVREVRKVEQMIGNGEIVPAKSEIATKQSLQKCFVARCEIKAGAKFSRENIIAKRTGGEGIPAIDLYRVLGKTSRRNFVKDDSIFYEDLGMEQ